jgi:hypothetical protein
MKGYLTMDTRIYFIKSEYDFNKKAMKQTNNCELTIQFKIMDSCTMVELVGRYNGRTSEEFKHQILCHKDQMLKILPNVNDQVENVTNRINENVDRVHFDQIFKNDYQLGLHGQLDLEDAIAEKKGN